MSTDLSFSDLQILHSWKEISSYTGRGIRTLQRYEAYLGFPIHRPLGKPRSSVLAFKHEIDRWLAKTPLNGTPGANGYAFEAPAPLLRGTARPLDDLYRSAEMWRTKTTSMQQGFTSMQQAVNCMQRGFHSMLERLHKTEELVRQSRHHWEQTLIRRQRRAAAAVMIQKKALASSSA